MSDELIAGKTAEDAPPKKGQVFPCPVVPIADRWWAPEWWRYKIREARKEGPSDGEADPR